MAQSRIIWLHSVLDSLFVYLSGTGMSCWWIGGGSGGGGGGDKCKGDFRFIVRSSTPFIGDFWVSESILGVVGCWFTKCCNDKK